MLKYFVFQCVPTKYFVCFGGPLDCTLGLAFEFTLLEHEFRPLIIDLKSIFGP